MTVVDRANVMERSHPDWSREKCLGAAARQVIAEAAVDDRVESLAEMMATAQCASDEQLYRYLAESDRYSWRAAARVAIRELVSAPNES
jgi:hypothetical protein